MSVTPVEICGCTNTQLERGESCGQANCPNAEDFRFEITRNPEPDDPSTLYFVEVFAVPSGERLESFTTSDPYGAVEAAREAQAIPFEERMALYADRGW